MQDEQNWPRFELVTYSEPTGIPHEWDHDLIVLGAPKRILGTHYRAVDHLELVEHPTLGPLVCFATVGRRGTMCLHPATRSIRWLTEPRSEQAWFVNTTLAQFHDSVKAVIGRFPLERREPSEAHDTSAQEHVSNAAWDNDVDWVTVGEELRELLRRIDPNSVANSHGYWNRFVTDVNMGDYSIEDVLTSLEKDRPD